MNHVQATQEQPIRLRRPSAVLEAGILAGLGFVLSVSLLLGPRSMGESFTGIGLLAVVVLGFEIAILSSVHVDDSGLRIGWWKLHRSRVSWDRVTEIRMPSDRLPWGYPSVLVVTGERIPLRPLRCHRHGANHVYAKRALRMLNQRLMRHGTDGDPHDSDG